jgi:6-phosphogluconolactonase (cycloisomerase 2 family)
MRKILAALIVVGMFVLPSFAAISIPSNPVISPVDMDAADGYQGYLYVPDYPVNEIDIIDIAADTGPFPTSTISAANLAGTPRGMAIKSDGSEIYVSLSANNAVKAFDSSGAPQWTANTVSGGGTFGALRQIAISSDDKLLYVVDTTARVIRVIRTSDHQHIANIPESGTIVSGIFGVAISPDNHKLAVTRRSSAGRLYVYDLNIEQAIDGTVTNVTATPNAANPVTGLYYPTYVAFSSDGSRIYVRDNDLGGNDIKVYNSSTLIETRSIALPDTSADPENPNGEALALSPNGRFLYVSHYSSTNGKVHAWRINTEDWSIEQFRDNIMPSKDGLAMEPDGSRIWSTSSDGGYYVFSRWTGFTDETGALTNPVPGSTSFIHPDDATDNLDEIPLSLSVEWEPVPAEPAAETVYYDIQYATLANAAINNWSNFAAGEITSTNISLSAESAITPGESYMLRVRADDHNQFGPWAYSDPFTVSGSTEEPIITELQDPETGDALTEAFVYDTVVITGSGFGDTMGEVTLYHANYPAGINVRSDSADGLRIYSWTNTEIQFGIPRRIGSTFIDAGANEIEVTTASGVSSPSRISLNIRPYIYGVEPNNSVQGETPTVVVNGTALAGTRDIAFGGESAGAGSIERLAGDDPDGTGSNDEVTVTLPAGLAVGTHAVVATVNSMVSNDEVLFTVNAAGEPNPTRISPNAAPTNSTVAVEIDGSNFAPDAQVELRQGAETITGAVSSSAPTLINCSFHLTDAPLGKWDVVVTNPASGLSGTIEDGFTVLEEGDVVSTIIDDFEGIAVTYPDDYEPFVSGGPITIDMSTADKFEGNRAAQLSYPVTSAGFRGYNANLNTEQDLSDFNALSIMVKVDAASTGQLKVQLTGRRADGRSANFAPTSGYYIALTDSAWTEHVVPMSALVEIDSEGNEVPGGVDFNDYKARITDYQLVITGNDASAAPVRIDLVRGTGYIPTGNNPPRDFTLASPADGATDVSRLPVFLWNPSVDPDGDTVTYTIVVSENADLSAPVINQSGISGTSYTPSSSLAATTTYYWRVTATDGVDSTNSETRSFTTGTSEVINNPPGLFELISPADGATDVSRRTPFLWNASIDPDGDSVTYRIVVSENADLSSPTIDENGISGTSYTPSSSLASNTTYYWRVTASDGTLTTDSEIRSFVTGTSEVVNNPPAAFSLISPVNGATDVARRTTFRWNASVDPDGDTVAYRIVISENADLSAPVINESGISGTSYMPASNLDESTTYYWRVSATDGIAVTNSETRIFTTGTLILDLVDIESISPATAYPGQTLVITGTGFGSSAGTISVGGVASNPTLWTDTEIRASVPSGVTAGSVNVVVVAAEGSDAASLTVNTDGVVIDDVEGGSVGYWTEGLVDSGYYSFGTGVLPADFGADARQPEAFKHGDFGLQVRYSYAGDWGGGFGGQLANALDLSSENFNTINFYINWDGSSNDLKIAFKDSAGHVYASVVSNDILSSLGNYGQIGLNKASFVEDTDNTTRTEGAIDWSDIVCYEVSYPTDGITGNYQYIDSISTGNVTWGDVEPPIDGDVQIGGVDPKSGPAGTQFTITGDGFGDAQGSSMVVFENKETGTTYPVEVISWSDDKIVAIVPRLAPEGEYTLKVVRIETTAGTWRALSSNPIDFEITAKALNGKAAMIYPNPFNPLATALTASGRAADRATIAYDASGVTNVGIYIYDMTAKQVYHATTTEGEIVWDGKDNQGNVVADGVYLLRVVNEDSKSLISKGKILVIKRK